MFTMIANVIFPLGSPDTLIWSMSGNQANAWLAAEAPIGMVNTNYTVVFEGTRGQDYHGDIAIDDIAFTKGLCEGIEFI